MSFEDELRKVFIEEVAQLTQEAEQCLLDLESNPENAEVIDKIFRLAHNIKGGSKAVGFEDLGKFAHQFESYLLKIKNKELPTDTNAISLMLKCNDRFKHMLEKIREDINARFDNSDLEDQLKVLLEGGKAVVQKNEETSGIPKDQGANNVNGHETYTDNAPSFPSADHPGFVDFQEEIAGAPVAAAQMPQIQKLVETKKNSGGEKKSGLAIDESIRVSLARLEKLLNYIGEMVVLQSVLNEQSTGINPRLLSKTIQDMGKITKELQDISMGLRMIPLKQTFQKMQRIARDTANLLGKKVNLEFSGDDTEVDKTVLENLGDPLVHMIRNAVDHGIETPETRFGNGKVEAGTLKLKAFHQRGKLVIEIIDDGGGINHEYLNRKAIEKGIFPAGTVLSKNEGVNLIFHPGFSSKDEVSEISGRGVGMDVVRSNIEKMSGEIAIETEIGKGTTFKITLPLTLAIIEGLIILNEKQRFVVPLSHVSESVRISAGDINKTGLGHILMLRGENIPLISLGQLLNKRGVSGATKEQIALVIRTDSSACAVAVDDILSQQQIVIKKLGSELQGIRGFSGSSVLGDGRPALILELMELIAQFEARDGVNSRGQNGRIAA